MIGNRKWFKWVRVGVNGGGDSYTSYDYATVGKDANSSFYAYFMLKKANSDFEKQFDLLVSTIKFK